MDCVRHQGNRIVAADGCRVFCQRGNEKSSSMLAASHLIAGKVLFQILNEEECYAT